MEHHVTDLIEAAYESGATELDLSHRQLTELPESIGKLKRLKSLNLENNALSTLPDSIHKLNLLETLEVRTNELTSLPTAVCELSKLKVLSLLGNNLTALPDDIRNLKKLQSLDLRVNHLTRLPASIGQLLQLRHLDVDYNRLTTLPDEIGQLRRLQTLELSDNQLTSLPDSLNRLKQLRSLSLARNKLSFFPQAIEELINLEYLDLEGNCLSTLPEAIGSLTKLMVLNLRNNQFIKLAQALRHLPHLSNLQLDGNEALGLPIEVLSADADRGGHGNARAILEYYFRVSNAPRPLNEAKLILVGRGAVGKSSLVNRLVHNRFDPQEKKTEGIQITTWPITLNNQEDVRLNVWDFGGQEIMHATHQFFLTQRSLYLLVLSGRAGSEDDDAEYWLKMLESFGGDSPVIVVLNKIKEQPFDVNRRALQNKYPVRCFIKTDCEDGAGIDDLRRAIERETDQLEHLRDSFPANWFQIKDRLAQMDRNYLSFDDYCALCAELGEPEQAAQVLLASYLHSLGIVLNYKEDPRLQDTHVLNPHWVTNGIYRILNSDQLAEKQGVIALDELQGILAANEYPIRMHRFIFDLMKKFELCFSFPENDTTYLVPELLENQEPLMTEEFEPETCLNFQYHYTVLPAGLLPRFIVRTHALSEELPRWRTGVILKFEQNRALVKADVQDKKVFISVTGPVASRRQLLAIVRSDLDRIHHDIRNLQPKPIVPLPQYPHEYVSYSDLTVMEQKGIKNFPKVVGGEVIQLDVEQLLNGIDLEGSRKKTSSATLFYSYAHKDESLREELETHLKLLQRRGLISSWHDRKIEAGEDWKRKIDDHLEVADIILLLISADFIASEYCYEKEMKRALARHESDEALVIPIIVRDVNWAAAPFAELQVLPTDGRAVNKWPDKDSAWRNVAEGVERAIRRRGKHAPGWIPSSWRSRLAQ